MDFANKDLRKRRADTGTILHLLTNRRIDSDITLRESGLFTRQQRFGGAAIAEARPSVNFDSSGHVAL